MPVSGFIYCGGVGVGEGVGEDDGIGEDDGEGSVGSDGTAGSEFCGLPAAESFSVTAVDGSDAAFSPSGLTCSSTIIVTIIAATATTAADKIMIILVLLWMNSLKKSLILFT